jgi:hypothetical protein
MNEFLKVASLSDEDVAKLRLLEEETGTHIMAFEPGLKIASLNADNLERLKKLETQLNVTLLVFDSV